MGMKETPSFRVGQVLVGKFTGERYRVVKARVGVVQIQSEGGPVENWTPEGLVRDGYRLADGQ